jgi:hypothetical protein
MVYRGHKHPTRKHKELLFGQYQNQSWNMIKDKKGEQNW